MSILLFGTVLDTVAAFAFHIMYTLGNTSQITQCGPHNLLQGFRGEASGGTQPFLGPPLSKNKNWQLQT